MIGALLSSADGGSSALCYVLQALCVGSAVYFLLTNAQAFADMAGMAEPNALLYVFPVPNSLAYVFLVLVITSARDALRSGGALEQLKVGEIKISENDSAMLSRWRVGLGVPSALCMLLGLLMLAGGTLELPPIGYPGMPAQARINFAVGGLLWGTVIPLACSGWLHSMYTASCLCRDEVIEVIKNVRTVDPTSDEWEGAVAQPALGLIEKMQLLSDGWSGGLAGLGGFFGLVALCFFTLTINAPYCDGVDATAGNPPGTTRTISLVVTAIFSMLPFLLAYDIAATSTWCDNLMEELNDARTNHGRESHLTIQWLETALKQLVRSCVPPLLPLRATTFLKSLAHARLRAFRTRVKAWASRSRGLESSTKDPWRPTLPRSTPPSAASSQPCSRFRLSGSMPRRVTTSARCPRRRQARFKLLWHHGATPAASTT
jgi:hypothetical protein